MDFYSYNGVELPEPPEWDKETYPYALIYTDISECTYFVMAKSWSTPETTAHYLNCLYALVSELTDGAWGEIKEAPFDDVGVERTALVWANNDVYTSDGTLYFAASEPVPVGYGIISLADYEAACDAIRAKTGKTDKIKSGDMATEIESIQTGSGGGGGEPYEGNPYLTFSSANPFTIATYNASKNWGGTLYYSTDTETWNEWDGKTAIASAEHEGEQRIYMRGVDNVYFGHASKSDGHLVLSGNSIECNGNIETLLDYVSVAAGKHPIMGHYCFAYLFKGCTALATAPELPATTLTDFCYTNMFYDCTNLTTAPELPATTLTIGCYNFMFQGCTALTTAPELPATTLADNCYSRMFKGCAALTTAPELPATTLAGGCCYGMFQGCTALTTAPELPATILASQCYYSMFQDCTNLTTAPELPATTLAEYCYYSMFQGCTALATAPELPATTLANSCYCYMFKDCIALTTIPQLPATILANQCYYYMFNNCSGIMVSNTSSTTYKNSYRIPKTGTGTAGTNSLYRMFYGTGGTFTGTPEINKTYYTSNKVV